jgi:hypothetical protein
MCTDAYREALTRDLSSTASSTPTSTPAPSQRQAAEADRVAESGPAMALAKDAMVVNGEAIDER